MSFSCFKKNTFRSFTWTLGENPKVLLWLKDPVWFSFGQMSWFYFVPFSVCCPSAAPLLCKSFLLCNFVPLPGMFPSTSLLLLFSHKVVSDSWWPRGLQHSRLLCPPLSPRVYSNSCPLSRSCYLTISSYVAPFSFSLQSFPASGSFLLSWLFCRATHQVAKILELQLQPQSIQWIFRVDFL